MDTVDHGGSGPLGSLIWGFFLGEFEDVAALFFYPIEVGFFVIEAALPKSLEPGIVPDWSLRPSGDCTEVE